MRLEGEGDAPELVGQFSVAPGFQVKGRFH